MASAAALALRSSIGRPTTLPSTCGRAQRSAAPPRKLRCGSDIGFALASERYGSGFRQLAGGVQNLALRAFHFGKLHGSLGLEVVLEHFGRALRHVLEDFFFHFFVGALQ